MRVDFKARIFDLGSWYVDIAPRHIVSVGKVIGFTFTDTHAVLVFDRVTFSDYNIFTDRIVGIYLCNPSRCRNGNSIRSIIKERGFRIDRSLVIQDDAAQQMPTYYTDPYGRVYARRGDAMKAILRSKGNAFFSCIRVTQQEVEIESDDYRMVYKIQKKDKNTIRDEMVCT